MPSEVRKKKGIIIGPIIIKRLWTIFFSFSAFGIEPDFSLLVH